MADLQNAEHFVNVSILSWTTLLCTDFYKESYDPIVKDQFSFQFFIFFSS